MDEIPAEIYHRLLPVAEVFDKVAAEKQRRQAK